MADKNDDMPYAEDEESEMEAEFEDVGAADEAMGEEAAEMGAEAAEEGEMAAEEGEMPYEGGEEEAPMEYASLDEGVMGLIDTWAPTTPEGEQYKQELQDLYTQFEAGGEEMGAEEGIPAGLLSDMRSAAASRAFGGGGEAL